MEKEHFARNRPLIFFAGLALSALMSVAIVLCVPKKPDVIAEAARPQAANEEVSANSVTESPVPAGPASFRTASTGERLYERLCAGCHGKDGLSQTQMARMMQVPPPRLAEALWKGPRTRDAVIEVIVNGRGVMPAFKSEISENAEREALADYVLTLGKEPTE